MLATKKQTNTNGSYYSAPDAIDSANAEAPMSKEEYFAKLDRGIKEYEDGHYTRLTPDLIKQKFGL